MQGEQKRVSPCCCDLLTFFFSRCLQNLEVKAGDCVLLYIPNLPEAIVALLGAARIGAPHCVVFAGFSPNHLAARFVLSLIFRILLFFLFAESTT